MIDFPTNATEFFLRPLLAVVLGGVLGWEREARRKPAGFRTMMMIALGSAGFTSIIFWLYQGIQATDGPGNMDPLRIVEGVAGGIGFLGAGAIMQSRGSVQGMTTAATIWVVGAIGLACGVGQYLVAGMLTLYGWLILWGLGRLECHLAAADAGGKNDAAGPSTKDAGGAAPTG